MRWNYLYLSIVSIEGRFLNEIEPYLQNRDILNQLNLREKGETLSSKEKVLLQLRDDLDCWTFVKEHVQDIKGIKGWSYYRRATKASSYIEVREKVDLRASQLRWKITDLERLIIEVNDHPSSPENDLRLKEYYNLLERYRQEARIRS